MAKAGSEQEAAPEATRDGAEAPPRAAGGVAGSRDGQAPAWAIADSIPDEGEASVIVGTVGAAMHMYTASIESLPDTRNPEFPARAAVILTGLRMLERSVAEAARRSRPTPNVVVALSNIRARYNELMGRVATAPGSTLGQRLYVARRRADLSVPEAANGVGLRADLLEAIEAGEPTTEHEVAKIETLITALGG
jgi:hypothetical protein